jgi:nucleotide-binding universal stress UspA family protein
MPELRPYRRVLALIRFDDLDAETARRALMLARLSRAELDFLHLVEPDGLLDGGYPGAGPHSDARALEAASLRRLAFLAASIGAAEARCHAAHGPLRQRFAQHVAEWQPDLVVTGSPAGYLEGMFDVLVLSPVRRTRGRGLMAALRALLGLLGGAANART